MIKLMPYPFHIEEKIGVFKLPQKIQFSDFDKLDKFSWLKINKIKNFEVDGNFEESYKLEITNSGVVISSRTSAGNFYGFMSLLQLSNAYDELPCVIIEDKPQFPYRGFMLDVGRYFYTVDEVKTFADMCAVHKINKLHWHLTEDQGWRIEIKKYPLLATKGSERSHTNFNCKKHGGFYTQQQIKEVIEYCRVRNIEVIPEIDMPGHMQAAIACYPYLSCFDRDMQVATHWGIKHDIICAGKESSYRFIFDVLDEIMELFDSKYIHLGGDEAAKTRWELCPNCQSKMQKLGLKSEDEFQSYFMSRVARYIEAKGKTAIMWNEIVPTGRNSASICWEIWHYGDKLKEIVNDINTNNRRVIYSASASVYIDFPYKMLPLKTCYETPPELEGLNVDNLWGMETTLWTEYVPNMKKAMYMTIPRIGAICELMWSPKASRSYPSFLSRLPEYFEFMRALGYVPETRKTFVPSKTKSAFELAWFNRRPLHWNGLHNLIDNAKVKHLAKSFIIVENDTEEELNRKPPVNIIHDNELSTATMEDVTIIAPNEPTTDEIAKDKD